MALANQLLILVMTILALLISSKFSFSSAHLSIITDKKTLLSFKSYIDMEPSSSTLFTWDHNLSPCNWTGVLCNKNGKRVVGLNLSGLGLKGSISPNIGNLSYLRSLELQNNHFMGPLPCEIGNLFRLRLLNASFNSIQGKLPENISALVQLRSLDLTQNEIYGTIPDGISHLKYLQVLNLGHNTFSGLIPPSVANISSLVLLDLGTNSLSGPIPDDMASLGNLERLDLTINNLSGKVPPAIYNMSSLVTLALASNNFSGTFPRNIGTTLPNLLVFNFCFNKFRGLIPGSLHNLTNIKVIRMAHNLLTGSVPPGLGNLLNLEFYNIGYNNIVSSGNNGLDFLTSLTNSSRLTFLAIDGNQLEGVIPESVGNLSKVLSKFYMRENRIYGSIPSSTSHLSNLSLLNLGSNLISGPIPRELGQLPNLQVLNLARNTLSGEIPASLGDLRNLIEIDFSRNELEGNIPSDLGNLKKVILMDLSKNKLVGRIPVEIFNLPSLSNYLNLSNNFFTGPLPEEIGNLKSVTTIDLSKNGLSGSVPSLIGNCKSLERLLLANNNFSGQIPNTLDSLKALEVLDISSNKLSGQIPSSFQILQALQFLNLSFNDLEGQVPISGIFANLSQISLEGNPKLCFNQSCRKHYHRKDVILLSASIIVSTLLALCLAISLYFYLRRNKRKIINSSESFERQHQLVSYDELRQATDNFNEGNLIGSGSFGSVYKGYLEEGKAVAIKVLNMDARGSLKSFLAECMALRNLRHRNLLKLITACSTIDFKNMEFLALVYEFMGNGSLDEWLSGNKRNQDGHLMDIITRIDVAIDVACALDYLHYGCLTQVVHCDIKPSNILLDEDMTTKLGDFGLAKLLFGRDCSDQSTLSSTHGLKGSIGYIPPEYGLGQKPSPAGDAYSYGITLLELFTGKRPTDENFTRGLSLRKWVEMNFSTNIEKVFDPNLSPNKGIGFPDGQTITLEAQHQCLVSLLELGLSCSKDSSDARISMKDVLFKLKSIKKTLLEPHMYEWEDKN